MSSRWVLSVLGVCLLCVVLVGCGSGDRAPAADASATATTAVEPTRTWTPAPSATAPPTATPAAVVVYTVQAGDTLRTIADEFSVAVEAIVAANDIENPDVIQVGQELRIPQEAAGDGATPTPSGDAGSGGAVARSAPPSPAPEADAVPAGGTRARVVDVVDGDTIDVVIGGTQYTVRYIGMDTPERGDEFYDEATEANANLVAGREVILMKDVSETDRYGRLLQYVFLPDGTFVNAWLVRNGYAQAATFPPDVAHADDFAALEEQAREEGKGLWASAPAQSTVTTPAAGGAVVIVDVNKRAEYVDIRNTGGAKQAVDGWRLVSEKGDQACALSGAIGAGQTLRVWALASDAGEGGFNCGFGSNIWSNSELDPAVLYDGAGGVVDRYP